MEKADLLSGEEEEEEGSVTYPLSRDDLKLIFSPHSFIFFLHLSSRPLLCTLYILGPVLGY